MNLNKEIVEGMYIALIFIVGYYLVKTKRINILWKILAAVNILSWACLLVILALDINVSDDFISLNLAACMLLAIFTPIIWFSDRKNMDIYSLFGNIGFVLVLNKEVNQIKNSARLKENLQKILGLDCYHKTWITISKTKDEEITLTMLFFSKKEFACFERKIDKKYIVEEVYSRKGKCINRNIAIASAIISGVNILTFYNAFYKCFKFKYVDDFISLLCLLFSLMILINIKQHIRTIEFCLWYSILFIILLCRINILNDFFEIDFLKNIASIIIIINLIVWIYFLHKVNIENNQIDINNRKSVIESETDIRNYIYNRITMFFNRDKSIKCDDNIKKYLWITLSASWTILLFGGKFIIDIINIFTDEYKFGISFVMVYVILNLIFLFFNFARLKVIKSNFVYEIVCDVSFVIGINIFVFAQRDTARFQVLILSAYLCCLYLLNIRDLLRKI